MSKLDLVSTITSTLRRPIITNTAALILLRGTTVGTRVLAMFLIARFAAPNDFGNLAFLLSVVEITKIIADFGLDTLAVRELAIKNQVELAQAFINSLAVAKLIGGTLAYITIVIALGFRQDSIQLEVVLLGVLLLTSLWSNLAINYFQARLRIADILAPIIFTNAITIILIALMSVFRPSLLLGIAILPLSELVTTSILLRRLHKEVRILPSLWRFREIIPLIRYSLPIAATAILVTLYTRLDVVILKNLLGAETVGYYALAFRMTEPFLLVVSAFGMSVYSHISVALVSNLKKQVRFLVVRYAVGSLVYGLLCCILLIFLAPIIIKVFLPAYVQAIPILQILTLALVFRTLNTPLNNTVLAAGKFTWVTSIATFNLIMISSLLFYFVPWLGAQGAALSLVIGEVVNTIIHLVIIKEILAE